MEEWDDDAVLCGQRHQLPEGIAYRMGQLCARGDAVQARFACYLAPMDSSSELHWLDGMDVSVVACDTTGVCIYMNERACQTFAKDGGRALLGRSLIDCHQEPARSRLLDMLRTPRANSYTVEKAGKKKLVHQAPFFRAGIFAGVIEFVIELPASLPHFVRES